ncbi:MAG: MarR family transcriptional regulator [Oscillospiraceae bacterium]|nr:MarR family transcriptional regulator [Oscillospiraceae bacterium]
MKFCNCSDVRKLHHYVPRYSGKPSELIDGDVFRIIVPLDGEYSYDERIDKAQNKAQLKRSNGDDDCALTERAILEYLSNHPRATQIEFAAAIGKTRRGVQEAIARLKEKGLLEREGAGKNGQWVVKPRGF